MVVGDSPWDLLAARRLKALGVGLLCGGYAKEELESAGAHRVYESPQALLANLADLGMTSIAEPDGDRLMNTRALPAPIRQPRLR